MFILLLFLILKHKNITTMGRARGLKQIFESENGKYYVSLPLFIQRQRLFSVSAEPCQTVENAKWNKIFTFLCLFFFIYFCIGSYENV